MTGAVFNIQKFSLNDGPGIRTVIFLKGCPLRCKWCANPESQSERVQILWDRALCTLCGNCVRTCPQKAIELEDGTVTVCDNICQGCIACVSACPGRALKAEGEQRSVEKIVEICMQDTDFYAESGGGVTLSGGEALMHPDFAAALLRRLKEKGIHTAIETTGYASETVFQAVLPYVDLLLFDIKHWDEKRHIEGTGVSNRPILRNMKAAIDAGKEVLPRLPVIPGYNDAPSDAKGFVRRLREVGAQRVQLLPFHQYGEKKYDMLGRDYAYADVPALHESDLTVFQQVFLDGGIDAFF